jgi:nitrate reductase gamma subunit
MNVNLWFVVCPYIALTLLGAGIIIRYVLTRSQMSAVQAEIAEGRAAFGGSKTWRASLIVLLLGHLVIFLFPRGVLFWNSSMPRLVLLEGIDCAVALLALVGWARLTWQYLGRSSRSAISEVADAAFLGLLLVGISSGLLLAGLYRWGSSWGAMTLTPYLASLLRGRPAPELVAAMPFLVRLHVFSAFCAVAVLPLTRLGSILTWGLHRVLALTAQPLLATSRKAEAWLKEHSPASWLWPEED